MTAPSGTRPIARGARLSTTQRAQRVSRRRAARAYTIVELMMSLAVLAIGISGVIAMQKVTVSTNRHAKNLAIATHIGQSWLDVLAAEAGQWNTGGDFANSPWLAGVADSAWFRPAYDPNLDFGAAFDALGNPVSDDDADEDARYCVDLQLQWLHSETAPEAGAGLIRAQVRVFWQREGVVGLANQAPLHPCEVSSPNVTNDDGLKLFHFVYLSNAIRQWGAS